MIERVISGGQTGADQAALRAARAAGIPTGGWAPRGWLTEAGPAPWLEDFGLKECQVPGYPARTRANIAESDGLIWFGNPYSNGGSLTTSECEKAGIDHLIVINRKGSPREACYWMMDCFFSTGGKILNVAGNRESKSPGIGEWVERYLAEVFRILREGWPMWLYPSHP